MYAKNLPIAPKFDYPYQEQQRYSGSFTSSKSPEPLKAIPEETLKKLEEGARMLETAKR